MVLGFAEMRVLASSSEYVRGRKWDYLESFSASLLRHWRCWIRVRVDFDYLHSDCGGLDTRRDRCTGH